MEKKKTVKAWAVAWTKRGAKEYQKRGNLLITDPMKCTEFKEGAGPFNLYDIFPSKEEAKAFLIVSGGDFEVIPCTISY